MCPLSGHSDYVRSVAWSPDGTKLASGSDDKTVRIWEAATDKQLWQLTGHQNRVISVHFSPDGKRLVSGSWDKTVMVWDPSTGEQLCQLKGHSKDNEECTCKHDAGVYGNRYEANPDCPVRGHSAAVRSVCFSSDGKQLTSSSNDSTVRNWDPATRASLS